MTFRQIEDRADDLLQGVLDDLTDYPDGIWDDAGEILPSAEGINGAAIDLAVKLKNDDELAAMRTTAALERAERDAVNTTIRSLENQVYAATAGIMEPILDKSAALEPSVYSLQRTVNSAISVVPGLTSVPGMSTLTSNVSMLRNSARQLSRLQVPDLVSEFQVLTVTDLTRLLTDLGTSAYSTATATVKRSLDTVKGSVDMLRSVFKAPDLSALTSLESVSDLFRGAGVSVTKFISGLENSPLAILDFGSLTSVAEFSSISRQLSSAVTKVNGLITGLPSDLEEFVSSVTALTGNLTSMDAVLSGAASDDINLSDLVTSAPGLAADAFLPTKKFVPSQHMATSEGFDHVAGLDRLAKVFEFDRSHYYTEGANRYAKTEKRLQYQKAVLLKVNAHRSQS